MFAKSVVVVNDDGKEFTLEGKVNLNEFALTVSRVISEQDSGYKLTAARTMRLSPNGDAWKLAAELQTYVDGFIGNAGDVQPFYNVVGLFISL